MAYSTQFVLIYFLGDSILRKSVIAGNWKMHMTCAEAKSYLEEFIPLIKNIKDDRKVVIAPPFTLFQPFLIILILII